MAPSAKPAQVTQSKEALLKSYNKRLKDDVKSILDNFFEVVKLGQVEDETQVDRMTQLEEVSFQMSVRSANVVRAAEALLRLVAEVKQYLILNDFPSVNEAISNNYLAFDKKTKEIDQTLLSIRDEVAQELYEHEEDYYYSHFKENLNDDSSTKPQ